MSKVKLGFKAEDVINQGRITKEEIVKMRDKLSDEKIPELTDEQILLFILACDHNLDFTLKTIQQYYLSKNDAPELFDDRCLDRSDLSYNMNVVETSVFPNRTPDGCAVLFHRLHDTYFTHYNMEPAMKLVFMSLDIAVHGSPPTGLVILFDMKGVGLMHLSRIKIGALRKFCHYLQEGLPVKLKEIHVLNTAYFIDKVMFILKPFLKRELYEQILFHPPDMDMEKFYANYLPKNCLPEDFGGELPNTRVLHEMNIKKMHEMRSYFDEEQMQRHSYYMKRCIYYLR